VHCVQMLFHNCCGLVLVCAPNIECRENEKCRVLVCAPDRLLLSACMHIHIIFVKIGMAGDDPRSSRTRTRAAVIPFLEIDL
jgi:hypothetical protein